MEATMSDYVSDHGVFSDAALDYMLHTEPNSQRAIDEAERLGMDVVFPQPNQLQLDIDSDEAYEYLHTVLDVVETIGAYQTLRNTPPKVDCPNVTSPSQCGTSCRISNASCSRWAWGQIVNVNCLVICR